LFLAARLANTGLRDSLERAIAPLHHILSASRGSNELRLIAEQDVLTSPPSAPELRFERIVLYQSTEVLTRKGISVKS
jgi:hypothetical protein